jgi:ABC-2 type transport system permease protein
VNRGLLLKSWREAWPVTLIFAAALFLIEGILAFALPKLQEQFSAQLAALPFLQNIIKAMIGADVSGGLGPEMFAAIPWVHPVVLALTWAHAIVLWTRVPAGEVDRGTIDVLLGLPVSRRQVFAADSAVCVGASAAVIAAGLAGNALGARLGGDVLGVGPMRYVPVAVNLLGLVVVVGAYSGLASSLSDRRGRALGVALLTVLATFLLNYLAQFWEPAKVVIWLSVLKYHQPLRALQSGRWPVADLGVLTGLALILWFTAAVVFDRRDLATT